MTRFLLVLALALTSFTLSAQNEWQVGLRAGATVQAVGQYHMGNRYLEGRFGMAFVDQAIPSADFAIYHNWRIVTWSSGAGNFFFDAGAGINVGGVANYAYIGPSGMAKFGHHFSNVPLDLSVDWSPSFNTGIVYYGGENYADYLPIALANVAVTLTYRF